MENEKRAKITVSIDRNLVELCDMNIERFGCKNRSDLMKLALESLFAGKDSEVTANIITPALQSVIQSSVRDTENHIARYLYKQAVEIAMLYNVLAYSNNISKKDLDNVRTLCEREVKNLSGRYSLDDIVSFQNGQGE